jgi:hypothetical protein
MLVEDVIVLSLHAWGKNLRAGMPIMLPTTTKPTMAKRRRKSRDGELNPRAFPTLRLFVNRFLLG